MGIELKQSLRQSLRQSQNLLMSPQIQQAIKILTLGRQELEDFVSDELRENPCLEEVDTNNEGDDSRVAPSVEEMADNSSPDDSARSQIELEVSKGLETGEDFRGLDELLARFDDIGSDTSEKTMSDSDEIETPMYDRIRTDSESNLHEELEEQLRMMHLTDYELQCAMVLLQYLDDNGFLTTSIEDICSVNDFHLDDMEYALSMLQKCEPIGVGARGLQECLRLQLANLDHSPPNLGLVERIISDFWHEFEKQDVPKIAKGTKAKPDDVIKAIIFIRENLDPRPARQYGSSPNQVVIPDVFIFKREEEWVVSLNEDGLPRLRISKKYSELIEGIVAKKSTEEGKLKDFVNEKIKSARWVVRAISERNKTILRVSEVLLSRQREFFEQGIEFLKPLTLKAVADELGLHESTISRTTTNKYIHTPRGIFELKYFFNTGMSSNDGSELANEAVKNWVAEIIRAENVAKPLSDQDISDLIEKDKGMKVARRTVAKYREALGFLPSSKRVKKF